MLILLVLGPHFKNHRVRILRCYSLPGEGELLAEVPFSLLRNIASSKQTLKNIFSVSPIVSFSEVDILAINKIVSALGKSQFRKEINIRKPAAKIHYAGEKTSRWALWIYKEEWSKLVSDDLSCMNIVVSERNMNVLKKKCFANSQISYLSDFLGISNCVFRNSRIVIVSFPSHLLWMGPCF